MATRNSSPGQALLRASRVFAIPNPLPAPLLAGISRFGSDTATLPQPTHQTISTPPSSLSRGDWGLKRSLPRKAFASTSTPVVRVQAMDTYEHITQFVSGSDHALNLEKFLEMEIPLTTPTIKASIASGRAIEGRGAFEEDIDITSKTGNKELDDRRWKFDGPWLAGQTDGEFNEYMLKTVRKQKSAFNAFVRDALASDMNKKARRRALEEAARSEATDGAAGEEGLINMPEEISGSDITDDQLRVHLRQLRYERVPLFALIRAFLDLPPLPSSTTSDADAAFSDIDPEKTLTRQLQLTASSKSDTTVNTPYATDGPPKTHPSAGLSYLRTSSVMNNHPVYGPQDTAKPVTARIIQPKNAAVGAVGARLGVAGFVTDLPLQDFRGYAASGKMGRVEIAGTVNVEPSIVGGAKLDVMPTKAHISAEGRVVIDNVVASKTSVAARDGDTAFFDEKSHSANRYAARQPFEYRPRTGTSSRGYGLEKGLTFDAFGERSAAKEQAAWDDVRMPKFVGKERDTDTKLANLQDMLKKQ